MKSKVNRFLLTSCTALTLLAVQGHAQSSNVIVQPAASAEQATPTVVETLMAIADRVEALGVDASRIQQAMPECLADAVTDAAGAASDTQQISCGIALESDKIAYFNATRAVLLDASVTAAAQQQLIEKDFMITRDALTQIEADRSDVSQVLVMLSRAFDEQNETAGAPQTREERAVYNDLNRQWQQASMTLAQQEFLRTKSEIKLERLASQREYLGELSYELRQAGLDQDTYILRSQLWVDRAKATGEIYAMTTAVPRLTSAVSGNMGSILQLGSGEQASLPEIEGLDSGALGFMTGANVEDGYAAFLARKQGESDQ